MNKIFRGLTVLSLLALSVQFAGCNDDDEGGLSASEQFEFENDKIDAYISSNGLITEIDENSLLRYRIMAEGTGISVAFPLNALNKVVDSVTISYSARILDTQEIVFSATNEKIAYEELLTGIRLALQFVREGGSINFFVPSAYGFGPTGTENVPPNSTLVFDLDLVEIHADQLFEDIETIDNYLMRNNIQAEEHITGLRYTIQDPGSGDSPSWQSVVIVNYEGRVLGSDEPFDARENQALVLQELITGWLIGLPEISTGGSITLYIPSRMGYGESGGGPNIEPNSNLVFDIDLISIQ